MNKSKLYKSLQDQLTTLRLSAIKESLSMTLEESVNNDLSYEEFLHELFQHEITARYNNRVSRMLRSSKLPLSKSFDTFEIERLPSKLRQQVKGMRQGHFVENKENILAFGKPGSGKSHLLCAVALEQLYNGRSVYFTSCNILVQELLIAKRDLTFTKVLKKLSSYDILYLDDIGYVQQSREEMEVLFSVLAERYERGTVMITSNLPFSKWETIFKDKMTTAAAIDRLVHHSVIIELNLPSYRTEKAKTKKRGVKEQ